MATKKSFLSEWESVIQTMGGKPSKTPDEIRSESVSIAIDYVQRLLDFTVLSDLRVISTVGPHPNVDILLRWADNGSRYKLVERVVEVDPVSMQGVCLRFDRGTT